MLDMPMAVSYRVAEFRLPAVTDGNRLIAATHSRSVDRPLLGRQPSLTAYNLSLSFLAAAEEQAPGAPNGVAEVSNQLLALPQIRSRGVDTRELEGLTDL